jgi:hypothetical protein
MRVPWCQINLICKQSMCVPWCQIDTQAVNRACVCHGVRSTCSVNRACVCRGVGSTHRPWTGHVCVPWCQINAQATNRACVCAMVLDQYAGREQSMCVYHGDKSAHSLSTEHVCADAVISTHWPWTEHVCAMRKAAIVFGCNLLHIWCMRVQ